MNTKWGLNNGGDHREETKTIHTCFYKRNRIPMLFKSYGDDSDILSRLPTYHKVKSEICSVTLYSVVSVNPVMIQGLSRCT
jgi:hypothetical protein